MKDLLPKGYLGWIWSIGILTMMVLVIYTLITDTSPFQAWVKPRARPRSR